MMSTAADVDAFEGQKYLALETFRKSGEAVRTPVWYALVSSTPTSGDGPKFYVYTAAKSGKVRRIRRTCGVRIALCDVRGNVTGRWIDGRAQIAGDEEFHNGMRLLNRKYRPWKQLLDLSTRLFSRHERAMLVIRPG